MIGALMFAATGTWLGVLGLVVLLLLIVVLVRLL